MSEALFDLSEEYQAMLDQGIRLSGEDMFFFLEGRLRLLESRVRSRGPVRRILDFGCGLGYATRRLREVFPEAEVTGADTSESALRSARERNGAPGVRFRTVGDLESEAGGYDLCYVNGVFHHIAPEERPSALTLIHRLLRPGGTLALFENNPWNPGARMVMARIPFDRDARMLSPLETAALMKRAEFDVVRTDSLFFFPRPLKGLRFTEPYLSWTRLGAQYAVLGART
ncbi:MAG TPA: class I SAM-dependent methyltransferase [Bryobacteraceae bacterium]|nr:class I SAM-dependent methyltransferase [Bryobacteraceae bacterium]